MTYLQQETFRIVIDGKFVEQIHFEEYRSSYFARKKEIKLCVHITKSLECKKFSTVLTHLFTIYKYFPHINFETIILYIDKNNALKLTDIINVEKFKIVCEMINCEFNSQKFKKSFGNDPSSIYISTLCQCLFFSALSKHYSKYKVLAMLNFESFIKRSEKINNTIKQIDVPCKTLKSVGLPILSHKFFKSSTDLNLTSLVSDVSFDYVTNVSEYRKKIKEIML